MANHHELWRFMERVPGPWLLKPRWSASAIGIERVEEQAEVWPLLERLGDEASNHLLESFVPGEIFHVDAVSWEGKVLFEAAHQYGKPPMETMHQGGVFTTRRLDAESADAKALKKIHAETLKALGMQSGVTHSEFIRLCQRRRERGGVLFSGDGGAGGRGVHCGGGGSVRAGSTHGRSGED